MNLNDHGALCTFLILFSTFTGIHSMLVKKDFPLPVLAGCFQKI